MKALWISPELAEEWFPVIACTDVAVGFVLQARGLECPLWVLQLGPDSESGLSGIEAMRSHDI